MSDEPFRVVATVRHCAALLSAGYNYSVSHRVEPGYWMILVSQPALDFLEGMEGRYEQ